MHEADHAILREILERGQFGHREHLELAWSYLGRYDADEAREAMTAAIRHVAELHGAPDKYHETITRSWVQLVAVHRARTPAGSFDEFMSDPDNAGLLDRHLLDHHYSRELIASDAARTGWTEPDLRALPVTG